MDNNQQPLEVYRPTVRYDPIYQGYVQQLFQATTLDRQDIIRLALFCAPLGALFRSKVEAHLKDGAQFLAPPWTPQAKHLWKGGVADAGSSQGEA